MGKVYGKNASGSTQLIIDGDEIDQRLSTLEANWDSISQYELEDCSRLVTAKATFTLLGAKVLKLGNLKMLYIYISCSKSLNRDDNINAFSVSGKLIPKQQIPISSDTVTGYIGANGDSWMTLQVARPSGKNISCCTCFYI